MSASHPAAAGSPGARDGFGDGGLGRCARAHRGELIGDESFEIGLFVHRARLVTSSAIGPVRPAHRCAQGLEATVQSGRGGPVGDVEDLGHFRHRKVEVVVQDQHGPLVDVDRAQLAHDPVTFGELCRIVPSHGRPGVERHVLLDLGAALLLLRDLVAGANGEPA